MKNFMKKYYLWVVAIGIVGVLVMSIWGGSSIDAATQPWEKPGYTLTAHDEFNESILNENLWFKWYLPHWTTRDKCEAKYDLQNGNLVLKITPDMVPWDSTHDGETVISGIQTANKDWLHRWTTSYTSINHHEPTVENFLQKYGYFEIRAKTQTGSGIHCAWWMIGFQEDGSDWDSSHQTSEVDIFEILGRDNPSKVLFNNHKWTDPDTAEISSSNSVNFDASNDFHVYGFEWNPTNMKLYIDGQLIKTLNTSVDYPMLTLLGIYEKRHGGWTGAFDATVPYPKTFEIDYWRAYQRDDMIHTNNEAEHGTLSGQASVSNFIAASNGRKVGYIGNSTDNYLVYKNLYVYEAGTYDLEINYISGENRDLYIQVNNTTPVKLSQLNSGGWSSVATAQLQATLSQGNNTIKLFNNDAWAPDIDKLVVTQATPTGPNIALSANVSAAGFISGYPSDHLSDGNTATTAQSIDNPSFPNNITYTWTNAQSINQVRLGTWYGVGQGVTKVDIQVSDDGVSNWTTVKSDVSMNWELQDGTVEWKNITLTNVIDKKGLRLVIKSSNLQWNHYAINEVEIY